jgi:hypothetical protein
MIILKNRFRICMIRKINWGIMSRKYNCWERKLSVLKIFMMYLCKPGQDFIMALIRRQINEYYCEYFLNCFIYIYINKN